MEKKLTYKSESGCKKIIAILCCLILILSFAASMIETSGGAVKKSTVYFDARGAVINADLYTPALVNDNDKLPAIVLCHGGSCVKGIMTGTAQELARRGIVVLNISCYGQGLSEMPMYDETDQGIDSLNFFGPLDVQGMYDAVNFIRTLQYVDQTKVAVGGHSMGAYRSASSAVLDCGYYTVNDMMLNFLNEEFGVSIAAEDIERDASEIAKENLDEEQMKYFNHVLEEKTEWYNTRIFMAVPIGSATAAVTNAMRPVTVEVAGHEVKRFLQTNIGTMIGKWDQNYPNILNGFIKGETYSRDYYQTGDELVFDTWFHLDDTGEFSKQIGSFYEVTPLNSPELQQAIAEKQVRLLYAVDNTTHSQEFFSNKITSGVVRFVTNVFQYNNGPLDGNAAIDPGNIIWMWREHLNTAAMACMFAFAAYMIALLIKKPRYAAVAVEHDESAYVPMSKIKYVIFLVVSVFICFLACYFANNNKHIMFKFIGNCTFFPVAGGAAVGINYLTWAGLLLAVLVAVFEIIGKRKGEASGLTKLGINIKPKAIFKAFAVSFFVILACYGTLAVIDFFFKQDYRWWMCAISKMDMVQLSQAIRYFVILVPMYFLLSIGINYTDTLNWKHPVVEMIGGIIICSLGIYINHWINIGGLMSSSVGGGFDPSGAVGATSFSSAISSAGMFVFVPLTVYLSKKTYKVTHSIWTGVFLNAMLSAWSWCSSCGYSMTYIGATLAEKLLGFRWIF